MPIGVPKVPFRLPGEEDAVWIDVQCDLLNLSIIWNLSPLFYPIKLSITHLKLINISKIKKRDVQIKN